MVFMNSMCAQGWYHRCRVSIASHLQNQHACRHTELSEVPLPCGVLLRDSMAYETTT